MPSGFTELMQVYTAGYLLLAFLPGPRVLGAVFLLTFGYCCWALFQFRHMENVGVLMSAVSCAAAACGLAAGAIANGIVLFGRSNGLKPFYAVIIHSVAFFAIPAIVSLTTWRESEGRTARMAEPAAECAEQLHAAKLGEVELALPIARAIHVGEGFEYDPSWAFDLNEQARKFCEHARGRPPQLTNLQINLDTRTAVQSNQLYPSAFCRTEQPYSWWTSLCRRENVKVSKEFPGETVVYVIGKYNASRMHAWAVEDRAAERAQMEGLPRTRLEGGAVAYAGEFHSYYTLDARPDFLARCQQTSGEPDGQLACTGGLPIGQGLGLIMEFRADKPTFAADTEHAIARALEIFDSLKKH
jgi:hypothetical protein